MNMLHTQTSSRCPTCGRPIQAPNRRQRRAQLEGQIRQLERRIQAVEGGSLLGTIQHQVAAPSCTLCEQAPPGKPGQPTTAPGLVQQLRRQRDALERELLRLQRAG